MRRLVQRDTRTLTEFCDCLLTALVIDMVRVSSSRRAGREPASASPPPASAAGEPACAWCCALRSSMSCAASSCEPPSIAAGRNGGAPLSAQKGRSGTSTANQTKRYRSIASAKAASCALWARGQERVQVASAHTAETARHLQTPRRRTAQALTKGDGPAAATRVLC